MTHDDEATAAPAVGTPVERPVRALHPERAAFERWALPLLGDNPTWRESGPCELAWQAWQAARPKRADVGRLVNLAAECAQRKPLRALEPLTEVSHIGHRQFARAYAGAEEAVRLLAIELRRVADAL